MLHRHDGYKIPVQRKVTDFCQLNHRMTDYTQLIRDCQNGNAVAQKQLYETFAAGMLAVCYRYTKSMQDAEDVLQEGFIRVFRYLHQYKKEGELGGWIRRIMVTTAINYLKKKTGITRSSLRSPRQIPACIRCQRKPRI